MAKTLGERYDLVDASIEYALTGNISNYKIGEQEIYRLPLKQLQAMEENLASRIEKNGRDYIPGITTMANSSIPIQFGQEE